MRADIRSFIPNEREFNFHFTKDECYKAEHGECPVLKQKDNIQQGKEFDVTCKCVKLIHSIIKDGFIEHNRASRIEVTKEKDGYYEVTNGRHRICAASKMQIPITIHIWN